MSKSAVPASLWCGTALRRPSSRPHPGSRHRRPAGGRPAQSRNMSRASWPLATRRPSPATHPPWSPGRAAWSPSPPKCDKSLKLFFNKTRPRKWL